MNSRHPVRAEVLVHTGEDVEGALRRLKKKLDREATLEVAFLKTYYLKPCIAKREKRKRRKTYE